MKSKKFINSALLCAMLVCLLGGWPYVSPAEAFAREAYPVAQSAGGVWEDISDRLPIQPSGVAPIYRLVVKGTKVWAAEHTTDIIYLSVDSGATFTAIHTGLAGLFELIFFDELNGVAISGSKGSRTSDGGITWSTPVTIGTTLNAAGFANSQVGYAGGGSGIFYRTADSGVTWEKKVHMLEPDVPFNRSIYDFAFPDPATPNSGYMVVANAVSTLFKTTDGGTTWNVVPLSGITSAMSALEFVSPVLGWVVGSQGEIFRFKDGVWTKQVSNAPLTQFNEPILLNNASFLSDGLTGWVVGNSGTILHTTDGGHTWTQEGQNLNLPTLSNLAGVAAVSPTLAFASGYPALSQGDSRRLFYYYLPDYSNHIYLPLLLK